jgi:hypothetical protein
MLNEAASRLRAAASFNNPNGISYTWPTLLGLCLAGAQYSAPWFSQKPAFRNWENASRLRETDLAESSAVPMCSELRT